MNAATSWGRIEESELKVAGVTSGTGFGRSAGLRIRGKIFAIYNDGELILKLPRNRVGELIESGKGRPWGPGTGRIMKEWVAVSEAASEHWRALAAEAARSSALARHEQSPRRTTSYGPGFGNVKQSGTSRFTKRFAFSRARPRGAALLLGVIDDYSRIDAPVIYQHPLAYLLGLEGIALLRAFSGVYDRDFTLARLREIQTLLHSAEELGDGVEARPITTREGYDRWAPFYDEPGNELLDIEQPVVREILDSLPVGVALDAACGTGRHTAYLASLGHKVIGVDTSPEMLARARDKVPEGEFYEADLHDVSLPDDSVDLVVCAIALSHVADLGQALAELVRVLRPNGYLVISDSRGLIGDIGLPLVRVGPGGEFGYMPIWSRLASDYLAAALPLGLQVRRCEEPRTPSPLLGDDGVTLYDGVRLPDPVPGDPPYIWSLHALATAATNAAWRGKPAAIIWHFQLSAD